MFVVAVLFSWAAFVQAKDAAFNAYCFSVNLAHGSASLQGRSLQSYFTTYDGSAGIPLYDVVGGFYVFSSELSSLSPLSGSYRTDYALFSDGAANSSGTVFAAFPVVDSDGNGVPDFLQVERNGSVAFSGTVTRELPSSSPGMTMTGQITRTAGTTAGSYIANIQDPLAGLITYRGTSYLLNAVGILSYDRGGNTSIVNATVSNEDGTSTKYSGSSTFTVVDANTVSFPATTFYGSNARAVSAKPYTLTRKGKRYLGSVEFQDGGLSTSWRDYISWQIDILDNNDSDGDGIPDLSDALVTAPSISNHPLGSTVNVGQSVQFAVTAAGSAPLSYQWQRNGQNIPLATSASFTLGNVQVADAGDYRVVVGNASGAVTSQVAKLVVNVPVVAPAITSQPQGVTVNVGQSVQFAITVTGTGPFNYQWQRNGQNIQLATGPSFTLGNVQVADAGDYRVMVGNASGTVTSQVAKLSVNVVAVAPTITGHPRSATVAEGAAVQFTVAVAGTTPIAYQWRKDNADIQGAIDSTLSIAHASVADAGNYVVIIRNSAGQVASVPAILTVNAAPIGLRIVSVKVLSATEIEANIVVVSGRDYVLEETGDFKTWSLNKNFFANNTQLTVRGPSSGASAMFYRLREVTTGPMAPVITQQPVSRTVSVGGSVTFSVVVEGTGPFKYQWQRDRLPLDGKTTADLVIGYVLRKNAGLYRVVVTGPAGSVTSAEANLEVDFQ